LQPRWVFAGHRDPAWNDREAELPVIGGIADQEDEPKRSCASNGEAGLYQRPADALTSQMRLDRQRSEQQHGCRIQADPPIADRPDQSVALARHQ
jgi:hypothetical protein